MESLRRAQEPEEGLLMNPPGGVDLPPPPPERFHRRVRRWWRSHGRHHGLRYWLTTRGVPFLVVFAALYVANGLTIGWRRTYDVSLGITSPADSSAPMLAW